MISPALARAERRQGDLPGDISLLHRVVAAEIRSSCSNPVAEAYPLDRISRRAAGGRASLRRIEGAAVVYLPEHPMGAIINGTGSAHEGISSWWSRLSTGLSLAPLTTGASAVSSCPTERGASGASHQVSADPHQDPAPPGGVRDLGDPISPSDVPGVGRCAAAPASTAFGAGGALEWMSAITGIGGGERA